MAELTRDVRPPDYAVNFAHLATQFSGLPLPITVAAAGRPPWLAVVADQPGVQELSLEEAVAFYAPLTG